MADNMNVTPDPVTPTDFPGLARRTVYNFLKSRVDSEIDVYVVWFCFILGGWKALVSTSLPDGRYYEVTYNREKNETYLDTYEKIDNIAIQG